MNRGVRGASLAARPVAGKRRAARCQAVEKLLRVRSAALPLARKLNVLAVRLASSLACALHPGLLLTFFNSLSALGCGHEKTRSGSMAETGFLVVSYLNRWVRFRTHLWWGSFKSPLPEVTTCSTVR